MSTVTDISRIAADKAENREQVLDAFRRWGYLEADLDPMQGPSLQPQRHPELEALDGGVAEEARRIYSSTIGVEFMHIPDPERRRWIQDRMEGAAPDVDREYVLERLIRADLFEQVLQARYLGTKRFSLEGVTALIPLLDEMLRGAVEYSAVQMVLGMSHRGRLNFMCHIANRPASEIFANFEDVDPRSVLGGGDVKYHMGSTGEYVTKDGGRINIHLVSNPSHLEAVDPVVMGRARAKQDRIGDSAGEKILPVTIHGDAAFAGQGIWAETLNFSGLQGFSVGGSIHVIANNLVGFTANPWETNSSRFASDVAKRLPIPIFHVNAEDPDAVVRVARIALEYRYAFRSDVVIDLIGYRRHGHSEVDDPSITQPVLYAKIKNHPMLSEIYAKRAGIDAAQIVERVRGQFEKAWTDAKKLARRPVLHELPRYWDAYKGGRYKPEYEVETGLSKEELGKIADALGSYPQGFNIHPKIKKLLEQRQEMGHGKRPVDYGMAEALAFASLLKAGTPVRLSGQDSKRGTFNQRHSVLIDTEDQHEFTPLCHVAERQARFEVYNSELSEAAIMGFEYGYSRDFPEALVLWEAQFGDFANGAQIIIDQFVSSGEDKWGLLTGLVLLLPHGYEGQGPEHSSARVERYLQLAAKDNMQIAQPSTAAQYFHLLRRQALRKWRKPLVVFTPKSMLRHPEAVSKIEEFTAPQFQKVIPDREIQDAERVLICTGKVGHELRVERKRRKDARTAIVFLEQLYPFPEAELTAAIGQHRSAREVVWVQEEPANMGAMWYVLPRLRRLAAPTAVRSVKRSASASPATGSGKAHELEQKTLLTLAFAAGAGSVKADGSEGGQSAPGATP
ncbi:MAG TPA: 2-oxoglutarate dehydrogenase E1 component [Terriglobales bacterium]|nr:2-oxoglutarate dehydrogenase E1 component [Terriglobales bacterium]